MEMQNNNNNNNNIIRNNNNNNSIIINNYEDSTTHTSQHDNVNNNNTNNNNNNNNVNAKIITPPPSSSSTTTTTTNTNNNNNNTHTILPLLPSILLSKYFIIFYGQLLSFCLSLGGAMSAKLDNNDVCHVGCPAFRLGLMYAAIMILFLPIQTWRRQQQQRQGQGLGQGRRKGGKGWGWWSGFYRYDNIQEEEEEEEEENCNFGKHTNVGGEDDDDDAGEMMMITEETTKDSIIENEEQAQSSPESSYHYNIPSSSSLPPPNNNTPSLPSTTTTTNNNNNKIPYLSYILISFFDVQANYLTVLAFQYTTFNSITLFGSLAIPSSMIFSKLLLRRNFKTMHVLAAFICICGVFMNVYGDLLTTTTTTDDDEEEEDDAFTINNNNNMTDSTTTTTTTRTIQQQFWGDISAMSGGILFGLNDVLAEKSVKQHGGCVEYLSYIGFFGTVFSIVQVLLVERTEVLDLIFSSSSSYDNDDDATTCSTGYVVALLSLFVLTNVFSYGGCSYFLILSNAPMLNLSLLTSDFWSVLFVVVEEKVVPNWMFFVALVLIVCGVCLYEMVPSSSLALFEDDAGGVGGGGGVVVGSEGLDGEGEREENGCEKESLSPPIMMSFSEMTCLQLVQGGDGVQEERREIL